MNPNNTAAADPRSDLVTAIGVFPNYATAKRAVDDLRAAGLRDDQIGVIGPEQMHKLPPQTGLTNDPTHTHWEEGAALGAAAGGLTGIGLGAAVAAGLMSPLGPVIAGGALVALLASAGAGAAVGGVVGALVGLGVPEDDARWYVSELEAGRVVVTVRAPTGDVAQPILNRHGALNRPAPARERPAERESAIPGNALPATPY